MDMIVANLVESNGKTVRENNLNREHRIPIGTLVEVNIPYCSQHGIRMFVCEHTRDCDGTPMYALYYDNNMDALTFIKGANFNMYRAMISDGFYEDSLTVINN